MTKFTKQHGIAFLISAIALFLIILCCDKCRCSKSVTPASDSSIHVNNFKKSILDEEVKILRDTQRIYIDKWRTKVIKGDSVYIYVKSTAPDTCSSYIDTLRKYHLIERNAAFLVHQTDSTIIYNLDSLNKVNDAIIARYKDKVVDLCDSITNHKCGKIKAFSKGVVVGVAVGQVLQLIK
jgi:hypothetical protein